MEVKHPFILREKCTPEILNLLTSVVLGSNGAKYQHQLINERIMQLYNPLFINLERHEKVLSNVTLCRRPANWYVRYFAFDLLFQSVAVRKNTNKKNSSLKQKMMTFFDDALSSSESDAPITFYAYIDPHNERSLWMSENFGFQQLATIATQIFSRNRLNYQKVVEKSTVTPFIRTKVEETYGNYPFYFPFHTFNDSPFYTLTKGGKIVAFAKTYIEEWNIVRLSGAFGHITRNLIPYIPVVRRMIHPDAHRFVVVDSIWCEDDNAAYLQELFEGILYHYKLHTLFWWVDNKEPVYQHVKNKIKWGLLNRINGVQEAALVVKSKTEIKPFSGPTYITAFDFI